MSTRNQAACWLGARGPRRKSRGLPFRGPKIGLFPFGPLASFSTPKKGTLKKQTYPNGFPRFERGVLVQAAVLGADELRLAGLS